MAEVPPSLGIKSYNFSSISCETFEGRTVLIVWARLPPFLVTGFKK